MMVLPQKLVWPLFLLCAPSWAADPAAVEYAVNEVLAQEGALFVRYDIGENGKLSVMFGTNEPEWRVRNTVKALQSHPDIGSGLFWTRIDTEFCAIR